MTGPDPKALLARGGKMFSDLTAGQKMVAMVAVLGVAIGGFFFVRWVSTPAYAPLFTGLSASDAGAVTSALTDAGTPYQLADGGQTVLVPQAQVYQQRISLAGQGLPAGGGEGATGYSLLDQQSMTSSDFQQKVTYQRALEGELAKTVQALDGVQSAVVHLAVPQEDVFTSDAAKPTASVLVKTAPGKTLSSGAVDSIVNLVSGSVPKLAAADVTVSDATGQVLSAGGNGTGAGGTDARQTQQRAVSDAAAANLQSMLDKVVGPGKAVVRVDATLNFDAQQTDRETYIPTKPQTTTQLQTSKETYTGTGAPAGGVLGGTTTTGTGGTGSYSKTETSQTNALGTLKESVKSTPGKVERMSVAVLLDSAASASVSSNDITRLVTAAAGLDPKRGDLVEVTSLPFDTSAAAAAQKELEAAAADAKQQNMIDLAKTGGLALLVLLALVFGFLRSRRRKGDAEPEELEYYRVPEGPAPADAVLEMAEARAALPMREPAETQLVTAGSGAVESMARDNPDDVARLLRGWISEGAK
ncbi:flagellar M-ring protein FliF [Phycicoccus sp. MAQZ13P-2]|uniref:flagellar basal-body MS-ring/collar protein FliF n=1 Tax=Phycicoccus mangrovi TaxID=2840470 RepID=UPI001BFFED97|nr:flagellar basal-body MS-ring/collar protein FliF [Phycicoccus mangrovi]MBT9254939.1 flagellar M-ring protein FliF [Phycicoccus mangrovi]MBT9256064.1 flagellar M-ring protein FliF [Phycicoccus mangrovi]MBT9273923.1 flagellar M-ring protein FliF [Phycicoccus mangrovi]